MDYTTDFIKELNNFLLARKIDSNSVEVLSTMIRSSTIFNFYFREYSLISVYK